MQNLVPDGSYDFNDGAGSWVAANASLNRDLNGSPYASSILDSSTTSRVRENAVKVIADGAGVVTMSLVGIPVVAGRQLIASLAASTTVYPRRAFVKIDFEFFDSFGVTLSTTANDANEVTLRAEGAEEWWSLIGLEDVPDGAVKASMIIGFSSGGTSYGTLPAVGDVWRVAAPALIEQGGPPNFAGYAYADMPAYVVAGDSDRRYLWRFLASLASPSSAIRDLAYDMRYEAAVDGVGHLPSLADPDNMPVGYFEWLAFLLGVDLANTVVANTSVANWATLLTLADTDAGVAHDPTDGTPNDGIVTWAEWATEFPDGWDSIASAEGGTYDTVKVARLLLKYAASGVHAGTADTVNNFINDFVSPVQDLIVKRNDYGASAHIKVCASSSDVTDGGLVLGSVVDLVTAAGTDTSVSTTLTPLLEAAKFAFLSDYYSQPVGVHGFQGFVNEAEGSVFASLMHSQASTDDSPVLGGFIGPAPLKAGGALLSGYRVKAENTDAAYDLGVGTAENFDFIIGLSNITTPLSSSRLIASGNEWSLNLTSGNELKFIWDIGGTPQTVTTPTFPFDLWSERGLVWVRVSKVGTALNIYAQPSLYNEWGATADSHLSYTADPVLSASTVTGAGGSAYVRLLEDVDASADDALAGLSCAIHRVLLFTASSGSAAWAPDAQEYHDYTTDVVVDADFGDVSNTYYTAAVSPFVVTDSAGGNNVSDLEMFALDLPGAGGDKATTPDSAAVSVTGDIDIRCHVALDDWTPAVHNTLVSKYLASGDQRSYWFYVSSGGSAGVLKLAWSTDGTSGALTTITSTVAPTVSDGAALHVRATLDVDNGAAGNDVTFYTSADGVSWVQLGAVQNTAGVTSIDDGTALVDIGATDAGVANILSGTVYSAQVFDGIRSDESLPVRSLDLPGASGDYAHTPDSASVSVTGDLDIRVHAALDDWTPVSSATLVSKRDGASDRSVWFYVSSTGLLGFSWSADGSTLIHKTSTAAIPDPGAGEALHLRVTMDVSGYSLVFYTSTDGVSWSQLGDAVTGAATSFFDSTATLNVGAVDLSGGGDSSVLAGTVYSAQVYDGIDGTLVEDWWLDLVGGTANDYISTPNSAAVSVTGDIDLRWYGSMATWGGSQRNLFSKRNPSGSSFSYGLDINPSGVLELSYSTDGAGTGGKYPNSTAVVPFADGAAGHVRVALDVDNGASATSATFYTSTDGTHWTQLGDVVSTGTATSLYYGSDPLLIGSMAAFESPLDGVCYSAQVFDGIRSDESLPVRSLVLPGASGDYVSTPDSAATSITGDIDLRAYVALDDWADPGYLTLVAKWEDSGPNRSYLWRVAAGSLELYVSTGTDYLNSLSSVPVPFAAGEAGHVRVTLDVDNGASQRVGTFYTSTDGVTWSQLGVPDTDSGAISIVDRASSLTIGAFGDSGSGSPMSGEVYSAQVYDGIDGTLVADFDPVRDMAATEFPVVLPGAVGDYVHTPDSVAVSVTGDIDLRAHVAMDDWTPALNNMLVAKFHETGYERSYFLTWLTDSSLQLLWSSDGAGTGQQNANSTGLITTATGLSSGDIHIRATLDVDDGAAGRIVQFFWSLDGVTWTQLGADVTGAATSIADTDALLTIGAGRNDGSLYPATGTVYSAQVFDGIRPDESLPVRSLDLPGAFGDYAHTPDSAAVSVTGDIDIRAHVALDDWTPGLGKSFLTKAASGGGNESFRFMHNGSGKLTMYTMSDGTYANRVTAVSTVAVSFVDGSAHHIRATVDVDNGASGNDVKFYTSTDGVTWSQLGATVTNVGATSIYDGTAKVEIGSHEYGLSDVMTGTAYSAQVFDGIRPDEGTDFWLDLPGANGDYASTPDSAAIDFTGSFDVRAYIKPDSWTPAANTRVVEKWPYSWLFYVLSTGSLSLGWNDGTSTAYVNSGVAVPFTDGEAGHIRATLDVDNGSSQRVVKFYTSTDGVTWTQLGTDKTGAVTSINQDGAALRLGGAGLEAYPGEVYSAQLYDGIDGTLVADFDPVRDMAATEFPVVLPGALGDYVHTPDSAAVSVTGDIDLRAHVAMDDWEVASNQAIVGKRGFDPQQSYWLSTWDGRLVLSWTEDGSTIISKYSTADIPVGDGDEIHVRATLLADAGATDHTVTLYTSSDGVTWTQLGTDFNTAGITNIHDGTAALQIGAYLDGVSAPMAGTVYSAQVFDGIRPDESLPVRSLDLPGASGDYAHTPDSAAVSVTGDIDIRVHATLDAWGTTQQTLMSKYHTTANRSYRLLISTGGLLQLAVSSDGTDYLSANSTVVVPFSDGATGHVRATLDVDNGAAGRDYKFYTSTDGVTWVQLGTTVTVATAISLFDGTAAVNVPGYNDGGEPVAGTIYSVQVFDGIRSDEGTDFWLDLPGASGDYAHSPDSAAASVTGDLDVRCHLALDDWTPGVGKSFLTKAHSAGDNESFRFMHNGSGKLTMATMSDGTYANRVTAVSTVAVSFVDGSAHHIRATVDVDNGASGNDVKFYTSTDGVTWSQLGATVTNVGATSIYDGTAKVEIGSHEYGLLDIMTGTVYSAQVYDGIDGTLVADFNPTRDSSGYGDTSITSGTTGEVWTVAGAASVTGLVADFDPTRDSAVGDPTVTSSTTSEVWTVDGNASVKGLAADFDPTRDAILPTDLTVTSGTTNEVWTLAGDAALAAEQNVTAGTTGEVWTVKGDAAIGGLVADFDPSRDGRVPGAATVTSSTTDEVWSVSGAAAIGGLVADFDPSRDGRVADGTVTSSVTGEVWSVDGAAAIGGLAADFDPARDATSSGLVFLSLPGASGDYAHSPDSAAVSVTGDLDIRVHAALDTWDTTQQTLVSKYDTTSNRSYRLFISPSGYLVAVVSTDGTSTISPISTVVVPFGDGEVGHVRATVDVDNGASGWDAKFYTSVNGVVWSQLGATVTTATAISIFDGTATLNVSGYNTGTEPVVGTVYSAQVYDGIRPDEGTDFWLDIPGASGDYAHSPDSAAVSVTGDLDVRCHLALDDWTAGNTAFVSKSLSTGDQRSWHLGLSSSGGFLVLARYTDGLLASQVVLQSTVAPTVVDGEALHIRATLDVDNGAAGNDVTFYTSVDGVSWSQLGDVVTTASTTSIFDSTALLEIGSINSGTGFVSTGTVYSAQVYDGIEGTLVADFNPTRDSSGYGDTSITSGTSGEVWTVAGNASVTGLVADLDPARDGILNAGSVTSATTNEVWTVEGAASLDTAVTSSTTDEVWTVAGNTSIIEKAAINDLTIRNDGTYYFVTISHQTLDVFDYEPISPHDAFSYTMALKDPSTAADIKLLSQADTLMTTTLDIDLVAGNGISVSMSDGNLTLTPAYVNISGWGVGIWHALTVTYSAVNGLRVYVDGVESESDSVAALVSASVGVPADLGRNSNIRVGEGPSAVGSVDCRYVGFHNFEFSAAQAFAVAGELGTVV